MRPLTCGDRSPESSAATMPEARNAKGAGATTPAPIANVNIAALAPDNDRRARSNVRGAGRHGKERDVPTPHASHAPRPDEMAGKVGP